MASEGERERLHDDHNHPHNASTADATDGSENHFSAEERESARAIERLTSGLTLFSTRRPQNLVAGVSSGLKNVTRGVLAGTASLVALPVMGYKSDGWKGAAKNLGLGVASCVLLSVGGAVSGGVQVVRGALNTPEAVRESLSNQKMWHHGKREWIDVRLQVDLQGLPQDDADIIAAARRRHVEAEGPNEAQDQLGAFGGSATGPSYYELLEVQRTATASEIRRAYAKMALKHHPDKNVGDPNAAERFKQVNEAYRVLSNEVQRAEYDRTGKRSNDTNGGDSIRLPGLHIHPVQDLLGGEAFLPWLGHLRLCVVYMNTDYTLNDEELAEWQRRRVLRIAAHLCGFLATVEELARIEGALAVTEYFTRRTRELLAVPCGRQLTALLAARLHLVATRYKSAAEGSVVGRSTAAVEDLRQSVVSVGNNASTVIKTLRQVQTHRQLTADDTTPVLLSIAEGDIIDTVDTASEMVLYDQSVSKDDRWVRMHHMVQFADFLYHLLADPTSRIMQ